jgi:hypothetical protein
MNQVQTSSAPTSAPKRGFASMSPEERARIASMGGRAAHEQGTAHRFTSEEARAAGSKGGRNRAARMNQGA